MKRYYANSPEQQYEQDYAFDPLVYLSVVTFPVKPSIKIFPSPYRKLRQKPSWLNVMAQGDAACHICSVNMAYATMIANDGSSFHLVNFMAYCTLNLTVENYMDDFVLAEVEFSDHASVPDNSIREIIC